MKFTSYNMKYTTWYYYSQEFNILFMQDDDLKRLGKLIKLERIRNDFSQEKLAEEAGVSTRSISLIESGLQHPRFLLVAKIAKILKFDINILVS